MWKTYAAQFGKMSQPENTPIHLRNGTIFRMLACGRAFDYSYFTASVDPPELELGENYGVDRTCF
jgi:hypothetical protein